MGTNLRIFVTQDQFEQLVNAALDELPDEVINVLDNVAICVEDDSDDGDKLGEYVGVSRIERLGDDTGLLPDKIVLYRQAICDECDGDEATIAKEIRRTLWHEIAHHLGWDDDVLETVENQKGWR
jgi:predicted Zn-dependent protease with MMP-like domain